MEELDIEWMERMMLGWVEWSRRVPVLSFVVNYIAASLHHDQWRLFLELAMLIVVLRFLFGKRYRPADNSVKLTKKEVDELIEEWTPEPLVPPHSPAIIRDISHIPVIQGPVSLTVTLASDPENPLLNFSSYNFLNMVGEQRIEDVAKNTLRNYGVGSCGPPGFYGTIDVHMDLEHKIAKFIGTQEAILYSYAFSTIASTIPAFSKKGDLIICDESVGFALQRGVLVSRSNVKYFKHNDMADLEAILKSVAEEDKKKKRKLNRRFIISEGLFQNLGDVCPLPELVALKKKYKYRLIIDESFSIGVLGKSGRGICEHFNIPSTEVDILTGALSNSFSACGGYCAGSTAVVDHQRLSGVGYCYSASMPAMLANSALTAIDILEKEPERLTKLRENIRAFQGILKQNPKVEVLGHSDSPLVFVQLKQHLETRDAEEDLLQSAVDKSSSKGILFSRSKYVLDEEIKLPAPSIRVSISQGHSLKDVEKAARILSESIAESFEALH